MKLHPFFQANSLTSQRVDWKALVTSKAVFVPTSDSRTAPSVYFESKPVSLRMGRTVWPHRNQVCDMTASIEHFVLALCLSKRRG